MTLASVFAPDRRRRFYLLGMWPREFGPWGLRREYAGIYDETRYWKADRRFKRVDRWI